MRYQVVIMMGLLVVSMHARALPGGMAQDLPLKSGRPAVALVNGDAIFLDELVRERGPSANRAQLRRGRGTAEDLAQLDRLITVKLLVQEARAMGLNELPEIQKQAEVTSREILREVLMERLVKDVTPDAPAIEELFREFVREWKTTSLLFADEADAQRARIEIGDGAGFAAVAADAVAANTAQTDADGTYHPKGDYLPQIAAALAPLQAGQVSPVIPLQAGFVIVQVLDLRHPENADARAEAERQVLSLQNLELLEAHEQVLRRDFVVVDEALVDGLDFEAIQLTMDELLQDKRVVADFTGAPPLTVGDLADYLRMQFFHGADDAALRRRMNDKKDDALDATLGRRLLNAEAQRLGIDKTNAYRDRVTGYEESLIFNAFVQKVLVPENKMTEAEVRQQYTEHLEDYSTPVMLRVRSLAFARRDAGEYAMQKLGEGADFGWLAANAEGQVATGAPGLVTLDGQLVTADSMPEALQKALAGASPGEFRFYASPEGYFYVLEVRQVVGATPSPYDEVREEIAQKLFAQKIETGVADFAGQLRAQSEVETYLVRTR